MHPGNLVELDLPLWPTKLGLVFQIGYDVSLFVYIGDYVQCLYPNKLTHKERMRQCQDVTIHVTYCTFIRDYDLYLVSSYTF